MTTLRTIWQRIGLWQAVILVAIGFVCGLVAMGRLDAVALIIVIVLAYFSWMARGVIAQAARVRPVEPPRTWTITLLGNLALMALGIGSFGWYLAGGGSKTWVPFLFFIAGMIALRWWRRNATAKLYTWRTPALTLLQQGEYKKVIKNLEHEATAGQGNPDKLALVALAYIELNKFDTADRLLARAKQAAPDFASVNGALGSLRRHQARYAEAIPALELALRFEESNNSRYYLGLCQYLAGQPTAAEQTLRKLIDAPDLTRIGRVYGAFILGQIADERSASDEARSWYDRMAQDAPKVIPLLHEEQRRHKDTRYGETLKGHIRTMERLIARRPLLASGAEISPTLDAEIDTETGEEPA